MKYLIVCAGDRSEYKVALSILRYFIKNQKKVSDKIMVCVTDSDVEICNFLKKKKINFTSKNVKKYLQNLETNSFDWLLNIWGPIIYKKEILKKFKNNLNLHPSYLPYAKGKDPYVWNVRFNYPLGITIHEMNSKIDSGKYFIRKKYDLKFPYTGGDVFNHSLKLCITEFIKNWPKIRDKRIKKKLLSNIQTKTFKRIDLINENLINLDKKENKALKDFLYKVFSQDFDFNKMQVIIKKTFYNISIKLVKCKKKNWSK